MDRPTARPEAAAEGGLTVESSSAPTTRVTSGRRGTAGDRLLLLVSPLALLLVAGAAWAGSVPTARVAVADLADSSGTGSPGGAGTAATIAPRLVAVPATALGLPVRPATEVALARAAGRIGSGAVAVAGVMRSDPLPLECPAIRQTLSRDFCIRMVALFALPEAVPRTGAGSSTRPTGSGLDETPSVDAVVLPGVVLPPIVVNQSELAPWLTGRVPVVFIGHYEDERAPACVANRTWCRETLVLERLVWLAGDAVPPGIARDPAVPDSVVPANGPAAVAAFADRDAGGEALLSVALLQAAGLKGAVDQVTRDSGAGATSAAWWYARSLVPATLGREARIAWTLLDARTGTVVAASPRS